MPFCYFLFSRIFEKVAFRRGRTFLAAQVTVTILAVGCSLVTLFSSETYLCRDAGVLAHRFHLSRYGCRAGSTQLILDVVPGRGGMFSLEGPEGLRFHIRSRIFTEGEIQALRSANRI